MTDRLPRVFAAFLGFSFRADRTGAWATLVMFTFRPLTAVLFALGLAGMLAELLERDLATATALASLACLMLVVQVTSAKTALAVSARLVDRSGRLVDRETQRMLHGTRTVEHFHDPEVLDALEVLRTERARLTEGADVTGLILGTLLRLGCVVWVAALATPWLLLVPMAAVASYLCAGAAERARHRGQAEAAEAARLRGDFFALATEPDHCDELLLSGGREFALERHAHWGRVAEQARARGAWRGFGWSALGTMVMTAAFAAGFTFLVAGLLDGATPVAVGLAALLLLSNVTVQMSALGRYLSSLADSLRVTGLLLRVRESLPGASDDPAGAPRPGHRGIELSAVVFGYPGEQARALDGVDLVLRPGRVYALVGANGSGKSTLVQVLAGLLRPHEGTVSGVGPAAGGHTSLVAQDYVRFEFPVEDSIRLGNERSSPGDLQRAVRDSGLDALLARGDVALTTPLGASLDEGKELSGGQWQRVAISRGLLDPEPALLLLDEPTSAIDPLAEDAMLSVFADRARRAARTAGGTAVIVTHRMSLVKEVDEVILMSRGRVTAVAPHDELLAHPEYQQLYHAQQSAYLDADPATATRDGENT